MKGYNLSALLAKRKYVPIYDSFSNSAVRCSYSQLFKLNKCTTMTFCGADIQEALPNFSSDTSVLKLLLEALRKNGNKVYQLDSQTGSSETFSEFMQNTCSIAVNLQHQGVTEGDLIVICCDKSSAAFSILLGTMLTGATAVLINPLMGKDIYHLTNDRTLKIVFCDTFYLDTISSSLNKMSERPYIITTEDVKTSLMEPTEEFSLFEVKDVKKHIPLILFTSGSTGDPKGVLVSDLALQRYGYIYDDESVESFLLTSTFSWISCPMALVSSILKGYTLILSNSKHPKEHYQLIQKYRVNMWLVPGTMISHYIKEHSLSEMDLSSLTEVIIGGEVLMPRVTETFIKTVLKGRIGVKNLYGMTEVGVVTTWRGLDLLDLSKASSCGYLGPGVQFKITDEEGCEVSRGDPGILWVKSLSQMNGYWNNKDLNSEPFDEDGFFRTGDIGYFDNEGFLFVNGRTSDHRSLKDSQEATSEIEDILKIHPDIFEAATVVKPDSCEFVAFVVKLAGSNITEDDIISFVEEQLKGKKHVGGVRFVDKLPRTANSKVRRKLLQDTLLQM